MKIIRVTIKNLNSLRQKSTIDFSASPLEEAGLFAITGDTGAGKTTILDGITLALYGKVHRNKDVKEIISYGSIDCLAELEFEAGGNHYRAKWSIWRARKKTDGNILGPDRELSQWNEQKEEFEIIVKKSREMDAKVEEICGLDYNRFCRSVMLSQGDFAAFLRANEKDRSDLLERITGTEIYSDLSRAAYQRSKLEETKLEDLNREKEAQHMLGDEEVKILKSEIKENEKESKGLKIELNKTREALQWRLQIKIGEDRKKRLEVDRNLIEIEKKEWEDAFKKLKLSQNANSFRPELTLLDDVLSAGKELEATLTGLKAKEEVLLKDKETHNLSYDQARKTKSDLQEEWKRTAPLIDQAIALDISIQEKKEPLQQRKGEMALLQEEAQKLQNSQDIQGAEIAELEKEINSLQQWLSKNDKYQKLKEDLPAIEYKRKELRSIWKEKSKLTISKEYLLKDWKVLKDKFALLGQEMETQNQAFHTLTGAFNKSVPEHYARNRSEVLDLMIGEIDQLEGKKKKLNELFRLNHEYQRCLTELSDYQDEIEHLHREELDVVKQLMSSLDRIDQISRTLEYKQLVFEQQQLIANYEKDRNQLEDGKPCPLCLSTHHPFREKNFQPFINEAKAELELARKKYDQASEENKRLLQRQRDLELQFEQLEGNEGKKTNGHIARLRTRIFEYEGLIVQAAPDLQSDEFAQSTGLLLSSKIADFDKSIQQMRENRKSLALLNQQLDQQEKKMQKLERQHQELDLEIRLQQEKLNQVEKAMEEQQQKFSQNSEELNQLLEPYGYQFELDTAEGMFTDLSKASEEYQEKEELLRKNEQELEVGKVTLGKDKRQLDQKQQKINIEDKQIEKLDKELRELQAQRSNIFGEKDPTQEKIRLNETLENAGNKLEEIKEFLNQLLLQIENISGLRAEKEKEREKNQTRSNHLQEKLMTNIKRKGFVDIAALRQALLSTEEEEKIALKQKELENRDLTIQQSLSDVIHSLEKETQKSLTRLTEDELKVELQQEEARLLSLQQTIGINREKLDQNEQIQSKVKDLLDKIKLQKKEFLRWAKLNDIIGMADGKKFRIFAQGLTLRKLTTLANRHLKNLNGRYLIRKKGDEDLELEIVDTFQADNSRSMNTLSGGESFLVSLALALGLSDLAGRNTQIRSLFIDEGFGTLDDSTLDLAISTLENLQASGKSIGIISHVKALKERISTQIQVHKQGSGFSQIEIVG